MQASSDANRGRAEPEPCRAAVVQLRARAALYTIFGTRSELRQICRRLDERAPYALLLFTARRAPLKFPVRQGNTPVTPVAMLLRAGSELKMGRYARGVAMVAAVCSVGTLSTGAYLAITLVQRGATFWNCVPLGMFMMFGLVVSMQLCALFAWLHSPQHALDMQHAGMDRRYWSVWTPQFWFIRFVYKGGGMEIRNGPPPLEPLPPSLAESPHEHDERTVRPIPHDAGPQRTLTPPVTTPAELLPAAPVKAITSAIAREDGALAVPAVGRDGPETARNYGPRTTLLAAKSSKKRKPRDAS